MVREALADAVPRERKKAVRARPKLAPAIPFIETILAADQKAPRKQRHTAHRIWCRIRAEMPEVQVCESVIRRYVRQRKMELRLASEEPFAPQSYRWGQEGQVDWYEAYVDISEEREKAYVFCMRSMASGGAFHCAFLLKPRDGSPGSRIDQQLRTMRRSFVRIISRRKLKEAWEQHKEWEGPLRAWYTIARAAEWKYLPDITQTFGSADNVGSWVVFNIGGNKCRLITRINYKYQRVYTLHVLSHTEYDNGAWKDDCDWD